MIHKKCKHGRGLTGSTRTRAWRKCGCAWVASVTVSGVRSIVNLGPDETQAHATLHRISADNLEGRALRTKPGREFTAVADSYQRAVEGAAGARPHTIRNTRTILVGLRAYWDDTPVDGINLEHVRVFIEDMTARHAANYAGVIYSTFRSVMAHAQDHGLVQALPFPARSRIKNRNTRQPNHLSVEEAERVIAALPAPYGVMAEVALLTGMRVGELAALDAGDLDRERRVLHVRATLSHDGSIGPPKTHNGLRVIPLSPRAFELLDAAAGDGRVFSVPGIDACTSTMQRALTATGLKRPGRGWHAFRHAHQTMLEASGLSIRDAAARMGHGANFVQSAAYGWVAEAGDAGAVDATRVRLRHGASTRAGG